MGAADEIEEFEECSMLNDVCEKCNKAVNNDDNALLCDGFCSTWYHIKCVNGGVRRYDMIIKLNKEVMWMSDECLKNMKKLRECKLERLLQVCEKDEENECSNIMLRDICKRVKCIEEKLERNNNNNANKLVPKISFAEIAKKTEERIKKCNEAVVIKPKKGIEQRDFKNLVQQSIDPVKIGVPIKKN